MKLSKFCSASWLIPFALIVYVILLIGCKDTQEIAPLPQTGPSLSSDQYSQEYSVEEAVRIFKSGDDEAIERVIKSRKSVIWDGKSKFKNGVNYSIPKDLIEKARNMNENFRRLNDMDRAFQHGKKLK